MRNLTPFFELDGNRYEIKRTRYLVAEYDKISEENNVSNEDKQNVLKAQSLLNDLQKYEKKKRELEEIFFDTLDDEDERKYLKVKALYDNAMSEFTALEIENNSIARLQKNVIDILEKIAIKGLAEQYFHMNMDEATKLWERFVDSMESHNKVAEWLNAMSECLFGAESEEEDNSFLSQKRRMDEEKRKARSAIKSRK